MTMPAPASLVNTVDCMPALKALNSFDRIGAKRLPNFIISIIEAMVAPCLLSLGHSSRDLSSLCGNPVLCSELGVWDRLESDTEHRCVSGVLHTVSQHAQCCSCSLLASCGGLYGGGTVVGAA